MFKNIVVAIDLNDETSWRNSRRSNSRGRSGLSFMSSRYLREVEAILEAKAAALGYDPVITYLERELAPHEPTRKAA